MGVESRPVPSSRGWSMNLHLHAARHAELVREAQRSRLAAEARRAGDVQPVHGIGGGMLRLRLTGGARSSSGTVTHPALPRP